MALLFAFLSVILFLDCVVLIFLILLQLPKKEAGAGTAFGGAATDALFGAGSGNALTTITKYSAGIFFGVALIMALITTHHRPTGSDAFEEKLTQSSPAPGQPAAPATTSNTIDLLTSLGGPAASNSAAPASASNSAVPAPKPAAPLATPKPAAPAPTPPPATNK
ncbi:MAG TPA: preprotein translocase subunit SecG [Candidatus Acidoferrum sp.]|nr:preprotein translocase subunit SecG [Candidatus Acidoferrum sp.]